MKTNKKNTKRVAHETKQSYKFIARKRRVIKWNINTNLQNRSAGIKELVLSVRGMGYVIQLVRGV